MRLVADEGEAAIEEEFFRSREFLRAEGTTHTLIAESGESAAAIPLLVRPIPGSERRDAISPYSYPGAKVSGPPLDPGELDLGGAGLVSVFVRDRLGEPPALAGGTERSVVLVSDPELPRKSRMKTLTRPASRRSSAPGKSGRPDTFAPG